MIFRDALGRDLKVGQKIVYIDQGMMDGEIIEIESSSIMDGSGARVPKIYMKVALAFGGIPPNVQMINVGNVRITQDVLAGNIQSISDLTRH